MTTAPARQDFAFRVGCFVAMLPLANFMSPLEAVCASGPSESEAAVEEFVLKEQALWQQRRQGQLSAEDWDMRYSRLIESEAERLRGLMPGILQTLGKRLGYRSEKDRRLEELLKLNHPTDEESLEIQSLLHEKSQEQSVPICEIAFLTGHLGRRAPKEAVDVLLASAPPPERSEDMCFIRALMIVGPAGYKPILERISTETNPIRAYFGVMALVAQTTNTDFPVTAGLGKEENWDRSFPKSTRALRRLAKEWESWWTTHENKFAWNPKTSILEPK